MFFDNMINIYYTTEVYDRTGLGNSRKRITNHIRRIEFPPV